MTATLVYSIFTRKHAKIAISIMTTVQTKLHLDCGKKLYFDGNMINRCEYVYFSNAFLRRRHICLLV